MASSKLSNANLSPPPIEPTLRLSLKEEFSQVRAVAGQVEKFLRIHGCDQATRSDCELAIVEGCNNAIKHTGKNRNSLVQVEVILRRNAIELRITDHGPGFAWPKESKLPQPENESGRGLYLIRRLMDSSDYVQGRHTNTLVLRKKRTEV